MRIALDAMGGDHAPAEIVAGAVRAARAWPDTHFILVGKEDQVTALLEEERLTNISYRATTEVIEATDEPVRSVRRKKDSSMVVGCQMVRAGEADAFVSAGNTGALMAAGLFYTGRLKGIDRPALAPMFPTVDGRGILVLDVGANIDPRPQHLQQYALMGSIYMEKARGVANPRIGLLNIGAEAGKGNELTKQTYELLEQEEKIRFVGNVEAREVLQGPCEVVVCDGFSGNILLKSAEGMGSILLKGITQEFTRNALTKGAAFILKKGLKRFLKEMDYREYNGAMLMGLKGVVVKAHGSSDAHEFMIAIRRTREIVQGQVVSKISESLAT
ncbi:phosphate acyltransferase PlsX [Mechercharimyces sp. CAU 1602]|uniref:phosphate acyltransferase PlsX n=1 Tax=Mechercharimyces sp. CAU 1602 TaxID=2973933 RepID=UPI0021634CDF|nr:phosphate acyltransferase PlsX [Mechercharimyces sp. CAU 1602]MCS1351367.1 phosphate acyltransferase PlsX [Mechercharimyces sp. CAU 1602]